MKLAKAMQTDVRARASRALDKPDRLSLVVLAWNGRKEFYSLARLSPCFPRTNRVPTAG